MELLASPFNKLLSKETRTCFSWALLGPYAKNELQYKDERVEKVPIKQPFQPSNRDQNFGPTSLVSSKVRMKGPVFNTNNAVNLKKDNIKNEFLQRMRLNYVHELMGESNGANSLLSLLTRKVIECFYKSLFDEIMTEKINLNQVLLQLDKELSPPANNFPPESLYLEDNKQPSLRHSVVNYSNIPHTYSVNRINSEWHRVIENPLRADASALDDSFRLDSNNITKWQMINATLFNTTPRQFSYNQELIHPEVKSSRDKTMSVNNPKMKILSDLTVAMRSTNKTTKNYQTASSYFKPHFATRQNQPTSMKTLHKDKKNNEHLKDANNESAYKQEHKKLNDIEKQLNHLRKMTQIYLQNETPYTRRNEVNNKTKGSINALERQRHGILLHQLMQLKHEEEARFGHLDKRKVIKERFKQVRKAKELFDSIQNHVDKFRKKYGSKTPKNHQLHENDKSPFLSDDRNLIQSAVLHELAIRYQQENNQYKTLNHTSEIKNQIRSINQMESRLLSVEKFIQQIHHHMENEPSPDLQNYSTAKKFKSDFETYQHGTKEGYNENPSKLYQDKSKLQLLFSRHNYDKDKESNLEVAWSQKSKDSQSYVTKPAKLLDTRNFSDSIVGPNYSHEDKQYFPNSFNDYNPKRTLQNVENDLTQQLKAIKDQKKELRNNNKNVSCDFEGERRIYLTLFRLLNNDKLGKVGKKDTINIIRNITETISPRF